MNYEPDKDLERLIQEELRSLPDLKAPTTLTSRVKARIRCGIFVPWWRQSWLGWPLALKCASIVIFLGLLALLGSALGQVDYVSYTEQTQSSFQSISVLWTKLLAVLNAAVLVNRTFAEHFLIWILPVLVLMAGAAIAAASGLWRLTLQENHNG
jgi:hypothetical protein